MFCGTIGRSFKFEEERTSEGNDAVTTESHQHYVHLPVVLGHC